MISLPSRGAMRTLSIEVERELTEEDLLELRNMPKNSPPPVKVLSARHKRTAMMVAQGKEDIIIADALGYTPARISQLKQDPGFQYLVNRYENQIHEESLDDEKRYQEKLRTAGEMALDEINDRLEDPGRKAVISTSELRQIVTVAADRTVAPPKNVVSQATAPAHITLNFGRELKPKVKTLNSDGEEIKEDITP
jgi:hypothetical protein